MSLVGADLLSSKNPVLGACCSASENDDTSLVELSEEEEGQAWGAPGDDVPAVKKEPEARLEAPTDDVQDGGRCVRPTQLPAGCSIVAGRGPGSRTGLRRMLSDSEDQYFLGYTSSKASRAAKGKGGQSHA